MYLIHASPGIECVRLPRATRRVVNMLHIHYSARVMHRRIRFNHHTHALRLWCSEKLVSTVAYHIQAPCPSLSVPVSLILVLSHCRRQLKPCCYLLSPAKCRLPQHLLFPFFPFNHSFSLLSEFRWVHESIGQFFCCYSRKPQQGTLHASLALWSAPP